MINKKLINKFKYLGKERYEDYIEKFKKLNPNELIELKAEYEANVNVKFDKSISGVSGAIITFIICGMIGLLGKFVYEIILNSYKHSEQEALSLMGNIFYFASSIVIVMLLLMLIYRNSIKRAYIRLQYLNQYLKENGGL